MDDTRDAYQPFNNLDLLEGRLGYHFRDVSLLRQALCHRSFANENPDLDLTNNERLEFLGDAVLSLVVADLLFPRAERSEGDLSRMRAGLVNDAQLAHLARNLNLGEHIALGRGEAASGGTDKDSILADAMEAVFGAVYVDGGFFEARSVVERFFNPLAQGLVSEAVFEDHKTRLQEYAQDRLGCTPVYAVVAEHGPDHDKTFVAEVVLADHMTATGSGKTKKAAQQEAAKSALAAIGDRAAPT